MDVVTDKITSSNPPLLDRPNRKAGGRMSQAQPSADKLQHLRQLALAWGKIIADRADLDLQQIDFNDIEALASLVADALKEGTSLALIERLNQQLPALQPCPECGKQCPVSFRERPLHLRGGLTVQQDEPVGHCPTCRRDFFPPADATPPG